MESKSIAANLVFNIARFCGSTPYNSRGKLSTILTIYFLTTNLGLAVPSIALRVMHLKLAMIHGSTLQKAQVLVALSGVTALISSNLVHAVQSLRNRKAVEYILQYVTIRKRSPYPTVDDIVAVVGTLAHAPFIYFGIFDSNFYQASVISSAQLVYTVVMLTLYCANLYNFTVIMQFASILGAMTGHVTDLRLRIRTEFRGNRCSEFINMAKLLNGVYNRQITLALAQLCGLTVTYLYMAFSNLIEGGVEAVLSRILSLGILTCLTIIRAVTLWMIADRPHRFNQAAEAFNNELFKLMRANKELCRDSKLFLYVTMRQTVKFTACGFFNLGYPLVTSIIAAATTYLVILLQFSVESTT